MNDWKTLQSFEKLYANENYKTVFEVSELENGGGMFLISIKEWERSTKGKKLWKERLGTGTTVMDKETIKGFGEFLTKIK